jgi:hypothetical protein
MSGLALAAVMVVALAPAKGTSAPPKPFPITQVNRAIKGDRLVEQRTIAVKEAPAPAPRQTGPVEQSDKRQLMDGCESSFSPVTMPSMAHIAGRCIG